MKYLGLLVFVIFLISLSTVNAQTTVNVTCVDDAYIFEGQPTVNYGTVANLGIGNQTSVYGDLYVIYIKWNLSEIPSGQKITEAIMYLDMYANNFAADGSDNITVYGVRNQTWDEELIIWNNTNAQHTNRIGVLGDEEFLNYTDNFGTYTGRFAFNVTEYTNTEYLLGISNITFLLNATEDATGGDRFGNFRANESGYPIYPYFTVTYEEYASLNAINQTFSNEIGAGETDLFTVVVNHTFATENVTASLFWNNTEYSYDSRNDWVSPDGYNLSTFYKSITIPYIGTEYNQTVNVTWIATGQIDDTTDFTSINESSQFVYNTFVTNCSEPFSIKFLNISFFDEDNLSHMIATDFEIDFNISDTQVSYILSGEEYYEFCFVPNWTTILINSTMRYDAENYSVRYYYYVNAELDNTTTDLELYLLQDVNSTQITVDVTDLFNAPQSDVLVKFNRYFIGEGLYRLVAMGRTDYDGRTAINLKQNEFYRIILERDNVVLRNLEQTQLVDTELSLSTSAVSAIDYFAYFNKLGYLCTYNNATYYLVCTFSDTSGLMQNITLEAKEVRPLGNTEVVCTNTTTSSSGSLSCILSGSTNETVRYTLTMDFGQEQELLDSGWIQLFVIPTFGIAGLFAMIILMMTIIPAGIWNPTAGIVLTVVAVAFGAVSGFLSVLWVSVMGLATVAGIFIYKLRT